MILLNCYKIKAPTVKKRRKYKENITIYGWGISISADNGFASSPQGIWVGAKFKTIGGPITLSLRWTPHLQKFEFLSQFPCYLQTVLHKTSKQLSKSGTSRCLLLYFVIEEEVDYWEAWNHQTGVSQKQKFPVLRVILVYKPKGIVKAQTFES